MKTVLLWAFRLLGVHPSGHPRGLLTCSKYEQHHRHLPLGLIQWDL